MKKEKVENRIDFVDEVAYEEAIKKYSSLYDTARENLRNTNEKINSVEKEIEEVSNVVKKTAIDGKDESLNFALEKLKVLRSEVKELQKEREGYAEERNKSKNKAEEYEKLKQNIYDKKRQTQLIKELNENIANDEGYYFVQKEGDYTMYFLFKKSDSDAEIEVHEEKGYIVYQTVHGYSLKKYKNPKKLYEMLLEEYQSVRTSWDDYVVKEEKKLKTSEELDRIFEVFNSNEVLKGMFTKETYFSKLLKTQKTDCISRKVKAEKVYYARHYEITLEITKDFKIELKSGNSDGMKFNYIEEQYKLLKEIKALIEKNAIIIDISIF